MRGHPVWLLPGYMFDVGYVLKSIVNLAPALFQLLVSAIKTCPVLVAKEIVEPPFSWLRP